VVRSARRTRGHLECNNNKKYQQHIWRQKAAVSERRWLLRYGERHGGMNNSSVVEATLMAAR